MEDSRFKLDDSDLEKVNGGRGGMQNSDLSMDNYRTLKQVFDTMDIGSRGFTTHALESWCEEWCNSHKGKIMTMEDAKNLIKAKCKY